MMRSRGEQMCGRSCTSQRIRRVIGASMTAHLQDDSVRLGVPMTKHARRFDEPNLYNAFKGSVRCENPQLRCAIGCCIMRTLR